MDCDRLNNIAITVFILTAFGCGKGGQEAVKHVGKEVLYEGISQGKDALIDHNNRERDESKKKLKEDMKRIAREQAEGKGRPAGRIP